MKIGRNEKCPCGSGKKYKRCCIELDKQFEDPKDIPKEVKEWIFKQKSRDANLKMMGTYINFVSPIIFNGKRVWALGNTVYYDRPANETFHNFIIYILINSLGNDWWDKQNKLAFKQKHFIARSYEKYVNFVRENCPKDNASGDQWGALPDGYTRSLMSLAYDFCSIKHTSKIPNSLLKRLKNKDQYQGARYEIMIAAIFARLGYKLEFLNDDGNKHCEFIAKYQDVEIGVEVKSRHRAGVINTPGDIDKEKIMRGDVDRLFKEACEQKPKEKPFMIFVDINSPQTPTIHIERKQWFKDIEQRLRGVYPKPDLQNPEPFNAIFFTNHSFHYQEENTANPGEYLCMVAQFPEISLPDFNYIQVLVNALEHYGNVPNIDLKEEIK